MLGRLLFGRRSPRPSAALPRRRVTLTLWRRQRRRRPLSQTSTQGKYSVVWRVVSSNDHPNDGTFTFTSGGPIRAPAAAHSASPADASSGLPGQLIVARGVAAVVVIGLVVAGFVIRRRLRSGATAREAMAHRPEPVKHGRVLIFPTMVAYYVQFLASSHSLISGAGRGLAK